MYWSCFTIPLHYIRALSSLNKTCNCALRTCFSNHVNFYIIFSRTCIEILEWLLLSNKLCRLKWHDDNRADYSGRNSSEQFSHHTWWPYNDRIINKQFDDIIVLWKFCISCFIAMELTSSTQIVMQFHKNCINPVWFIAFFLKFLKENLHFVIMYIL